MQQVFAMKKIALFAAVLALSGTGAAAPVLAYSGEDYVVCRLNPAGDNYLSLRTCGSSKCREIMRLGPGTFLSTMEPYTVRGWRQVIVKRNAQDESYSGPDGWVYSKYICRIEY